MIAKHCITNWHIAPLVAVFGEYINTCCDVMHVYQYLSSALFTCQHIFPGISIDVAVI